jgi:hypothetical protein
MRSEALTLVTHWLPFAISAVTACNVLTDHWHRVDQTLTRRELTASRLLAGSSATIRAMPIAEVKP